MTGHAVLTSCHNCGAVDRQLYVVKTSQDGECEEPYHHVHLTVACDSCRVGIWEAQK